MSYNKFTYKVRFGDTDAAGIVYYPNFYRWMDQASQELFHSWGISLQRLLKEEGLAIPAVEAHCQFYKPALFEDVLEIHSEVVDVRNKVFKIENRFMRGETLLAEGYEIRAWALFDGERVKAVPIPDWLRELMTASKVK